MRGIDFLFWFGFGSVFERKIGFGSERVWFSSVKKMRLSSDIRVS